MTNRIVDEIKESFKLGSNLTKLIYINLGVFLVIRLLHVILFLAGTGLSEELIQVLSVPANINTLIYQPWSIVTYMFLHFEFLHILFNMLWLFWFGRIFLQYLTQKQFLTTYLVGGLSGALMFILFYNISPAFSGIQQVAVALGASASVSAVVLAISFYRPNYELNLIFIGPVKLKVIALVFILLDVLQIAGPNSGGHIAHLGGALYGYLFAVQLKKGKDVGRGFSRFLDGVATLFKRKPKMKVSYKSNARNMQDLDYNKSKAETQKEVDRILDKIAKSGYDSLSKREKETLFKMGENK